MKNLKEVKEEILKDYYNNIPIKSICIKYNISDPLLYKFFKTEKIKRRRKLRAKSKHFIQEDIFNLIDNPSKAYWLGLIMADGCVTNKDTKLSFCVADMEIPIKFKEFLKTSTPTGSRKVFDKRTNKTYMQYSIQVHSVRLIDSLKTYSIDNNKSSSGVFPNIKECYFKDFIRGLFDGDGSICKISRGNIKVSLIATEPILSFIQNYMIDKFNFSRTKILNVCNNKRAKQFKLYINRKIDQENFLTFIYENSNESNRLSRKYDKYKELFIKETI